MKVNEHKNIDDTLHDNQKDGQKIVNRSLSPEEMASYHERTQQLSQINLTSKKNLEVSKDNPFMRPYYTKPT